MRLIWRKWTYITKKIFSFLFGIFLILFYLGFFIPISLLIKLFSSKSISKFYKNDQETFWVKKKINVNNLKLARKQ